MEQHPVPQNILEVEFKLFGSFTLKQFAKLIFGCLGAVVIYFIPFIPIIFKFPLMIGAVALGVLTATIPNFARWTNGFARALFISPRYVWIKSNPTDNILAPKQSEMSIANTKIASATKNQKLDIADIPLDKLFSSDLKKENQSNIQADLSGNQAQSDNFSRIYDDAFDKTLNSKSEILNKPQSLNVQTSKEVNSEHKLKFKTIVEYKEAIDKLKFELSKFSKSDPRYKQLEIQTMNQINELFSEVKLLQKTGQSNQMQLTTGNLENAKGEDVSGLKRNIYGIVVDKKDQPIANVEIELKNPASKKVFKVTSNEGGKFATGDQVPIGSYNVEIHHPKLKFHTYKLDVTEAQLPAFKFRER